MIQKNITPTKSNYMTLKDELSLAKEGHGLLEQKREVLVMNLTSLMGQIRDKRKQLDDILAKAFRQLSLVKLESGTIALDMIVQSIAKDYEVDMLPYSVMGVAVPKLIFHEQKNLSKSLIPLGISGTSPNFDVLYQLARQIRELMADVAYLESTAWRLTSEVSKTQRRINALESFTIPDAQDTIKFISDTLEEKERETLYQVKKIKEKHSKAQAKKRSEA